MRYDDLAKAIYDRARDWAQASFFRSPLVTSGESTVYFTNGVTMFMRPEDRELLVLFCDLHPGEAWPHGAEMLLYYPRTGFPPRDNILGWTYVTSGIDTEKSQITLDDVTALVQEQLNRLRMRERLMLLGLSRQSWRVAPLFKPDHGAISAVTGVPESTVRRFFDGKPVALDVRDKILMAFNALPEELEAKLWSP